MTTPDIAGNGPAPAKRGVAAELPAPPAGLRARLLARGTRLLIARAARRVAIRVEFPDGTVLNGSPDVLPRLIIRRPGEFFRRVGADGLIGFGEAYMAGDWTAPDPAAVLTELAKELTWLVPRPLQAMRPLFVRTPPDTDEGSLANARANISRHYDLSNAMFGLFLDDTMSYSSALFTDPATSTWSELATAQHRKIDRLLDLAAVGPGTRLLEIGTGWGELCVRAAARGARVHSITLSSEQLESARQRVTAAGYADSVRIELCDYRDAVGNYDAIVSVEMIEAVGHRYWPSYFRALDTLLAPGGRVALQSITMPHNRMLATRDTYTWIQKYIFPGGFLPSREAIESSARDNTGLRVTAHFAMGEHYGHTLRLWRERFAANARPAAELGFDATFRRMWDFYLAYSEAGFRSGYLDVYQFLLTRPAGAQPLATAGEQL